MASTRVEIDEGAFHLFIQDVTTKVLTKVCIQVVNRAKQLCPVDTGRLRSSITWELTGDGARVGSDVQYAAYVELGTYKMAAQPYLRPAAAAAKGVIGLA